MLKVNSLMANFGKRIVNKYPNINYPKEPANKSGIAFWNIPLIGESTERNREDGGFYWELRPELFVALKKIFQKPQKVLNETSTDINSTCYEEGAKKQITVNVYERNQYGHRLRRKQAISVTQKSAYKSGHKWGGGVRIKARCAPKSPCNSPRAGLPSGSAPCAHR